MNKYGELLKGPRKTTLEQRGEFPFEHRPNKMWAGDKTINRLRLSRAEDYFKLIKNAQFGTNRLLEKQKRWAYRREVLRLKRELNASTNVPDSTKRKLARIPQRTIWLPVRYDNLAKVLSELPKSDPFEGKEVMYSLADKTPDNFSPEYAAKTNMFSATESTLTQPGNTKYNAKIFFDNSVFLQNEYMRADNYGFIKGSNIDKFLAVQIYDSDPKVLLDFTKAMLKRRPNDPIIVLDLYGVVFFP